MEAERDSPLKVSVDVLTDSLPSDEIYASPDDTEIDVLLTQTILRPQIWSFKLVAVDSEAI